MSKDPWPTELRLREGGRKLAIAFDDGVAHEFTAEFLRVESPSAEVQGHSPDQRKTVPGKKDVAIITATPIGNYAVKLGFDDMHDTGIFSWTYLRQLGREQESRWARYLDELTAQGLSRETRRT